jgi:hypothetical protein
MRSRLPNIPVLRSVNATIGAEQFNRTRLALMRLENPLRLVLPGLRGLDMMIERDTWLCIDRTLNDLPVLAWTDFQVAGRGLHEPVACRSLYFHAYANVIVKTALADVHRILNERLRRAEGRRDGNVLTLKDYRDHAVNK